MSLCLTRRNTPETSPLSTKKKRRSALYNQEDRHLHRDRGRIEPAVSGGFGSQFSRRTSEKRRHVAPAHPAGWGAASITSHLRCARHTGSLSPMTTSPQPVCIGARISGESVALDLEERRRHLYVVGQTGTGKSTLLLNLIEQDLAAGDRPRAARPSWRLGRGGAYSCTEGAAATTSSTSIRPISAGRSGLIPSLRSATT